MGGFKIQGTSGNEAEVTGGNVHTNPPLTAPDAGFAAMVCENDSGSLTGDRYMKEPYTNNNFRQSCGIDTALFDFQFTGTFQDTGFWKCLFTTMTITESGGFINLNANSTAAAGAGCALQSWRHFKLMGNAALFSVSTISFTEAPLSGQTIEFGLFLATSTTAPTDGVFYRFTMAGLVGVIAYSGSETIVPLFTNAGVDVYQPTPNVNDQYALNLTQKMAEFWIDDLLAGSAPVPPGQGQPFQTSSLPWTFQQRNIGAIGAGTQCVTKAANLHIDQVDLHTTMPFSHQCAAQGQASYQGQQGNAAPGSSALYTNSLAPGAGTAMTNTTAAAGTGLGGQFAILPTLAANTDGIVWSFQNPIGGVGQTPRTLVITGLHLNGLVTTAFGGGSGPVFYAYSLAFGHTAVSLATAESASFANNTTKAPRRIPIGYETYANAAPLGTLGGTGITISFASSPVVVNSGEFVALCAKNFGSVTTTGVITILCAVEGYYI